MSTPTNTNETDDEPSIEQRREALEELGWDTSHLDAETVDVEAASELVEIEHMLQRADDLGVDVEAEALEARRNELRDRLDYTPDRKTELLSELQSKRQVLKLARVADGWEDTVEHLEGEVETLEAKLTDLDEDVGAETFQSRPTVFDRDPHTEVMVAKALKRWDLGEDEAETAAEEASLRAETLEEDGRSGEAETERLRAEILEAAADGQKTAELTREERRRANIMWDV